MTETARVPKHPFPASSSPDSRLATRDSRISLIPFKTGDQVIELIGPECMRDRRQVRIVEMGDDHVVTETGHVYTRRGTSIPRDDTPYRSIISPDYAKPGCHCSPSSAQQCSSPDSYDDIGVGNLDCPEPAVTAGGRRPRTAHGESQRPLRFGAVADTQPPRLPDSRLATRDFAAFSIFDLAVWLAAFAAGATMPLTFRGAWWWLALTAWLFLSALILRAAAARGFLPPMDLYASHGQRRTTPSKAVQAKLKRRSRGRHCR